MDHLDKAASLVHAAKNRLQLLQPKLDHLLQHGDLDVQSTGRVVHQELNEINQQLVLMLSLYRLDGLSAIHAEPLPLLDELELCASRMPEASIMVQCPPELEVYADRPLLNAVISDALHNALKFHVCEITMTAETKDSGVVVRILDDGCEQSGHTEVGSGVGLWLADKIAKAHKNHGCHGYAKHQFDAELGSCFELYLP